MAVVFIMLDGLRPDALQKADAPALHAFRDRSAYTLNARSVMPSVTLPCHMAIFHSVPPQRHGILSNDWHPMARPVTGLIEQLKAHDKRAGFFYNWEPLRNLSRPEQLYFSFFIDSSAQLEGGDTLVANAAAPYLKESAFDFTFIYLGTIDVAGHVYGWMEDGYLQQIAAVDREVGKVLDAIPEDTTVIIHADHGGHDRSHGTEMPEDMTIPWMIAGPNIKPGLIEREVSLLDTAPTVAHLLGVPANKDWEGLAVTEALV